MIRWISEIWYGFDSQILRKSFASTGITSQHPDDYNPILRSVLRKETLPSRILDDCSLLDDLPCVDESDSEREESNWDESSDQDDSSQQDQSSDQDVSTRDQDNDSNDDGLDVQGD